MTRDPCDPYFTAINLVSFFLFLIQTLHGFFPPRLAHWINPVVLDNVPSDKSGYGQTAKQWAVVILKGFMTKSSLTAKLNISPSLNEGEAVVRA